MVIKAFYNDLVSGDVLKITDMRRAGVPRTVTMAITGHAIRDMNERYDSVEDWEKMEAIKKLGIYRESGTKVVQTKSYLSDSPA